MRRLGTLLGTLGVVGLGMALLVPVAFAYSSGAFTKAFATPDWTKGSFTAQANAAPCGPGYCSYFPIVFAQPSLPEYGCTSEEFAESDRNIQQVWKGPVESANASFSAEASEVPILHGVYGQRYCLEVIGEREVPDRICEAQRTVLEEFGSGPISCPPIKKVFGEYVTGAVMTVEVPPPPSPVPSAPPAPPAASQPTPSCAQREVAVTGAWKRVGIARSAYRHAKGSRARRLRREAWQRDKREALQTERQQNELCG